MRFGLVTASARASPELSMAGTLGRNWNPTGTCPAMKSGVYWAMLR